LQLFTKDAALDYSDAGAIKGKPKDIAQWFEKALNFKLMSFHQHMITNVRIQFDQHDENRAFVRAMLHNPMGAPFIFPKTPLFFVGGWYNHQMVKGTDNKWRSEGLTADIAYNTIFSSIVIWVFLLGALCVLYLKSVG